MYESELSAAELYNLNGRVTSAANCAIEQFRFWTVFYLPRQELVPDNFAESST